MSLLIRKASPSDANAIAELFDAYRVWYHQSADLSKARQFISDRLENEESVIFVAEHDGRLVGFTQLYPIFSSVSMSKAWLLNDLFVAANERGKGIASNLLNAARQHGCETGSKWLMLQTSCDNLAAQALYEKTGWRRETDQFYMLDL
ncbi:MAG: family N-acetyltransferase [Chitinophagaceae bacterium]|jgi:GNAT superfamily N-acetyltransferase|nr:family N-acetyltransferase [Chitinophagaceae bacterium]